MSLKELVGGISVALVFYAYAYYAFCILKGKIRPHAFSWIVWTLVCGVVFAAQIIKGAGAGAWLTAAATFSCALVAVCAFRYGEKRITRSDWYSFLAVLAGIPLWMATGDPLWSVILVTMIGLTGFWPALRKSWSAPWSELAQIYFLLGPAYALSFFALKNITLPTACFPVALMVANTGFGILLLVRRRVMSTAQPFTAAVMIIGNEILSGRTQDENIRFLAEKLSARGITLSEVRIVRDEEAAIVKAVRELSAGYNAVFSTGGIGPTHDDITTDCMAKAFDVPLEINAEARRRLEEYYKPRGVELNEARLRMAHVPKGASLIDNSISVAPGFKIGNVYVMAGVPPIMQAMFLAIEPELPQGLPVLSRTVRGAMREGDIALELAGIQRAFPDVEIGSYPAMGRAKPDVSLVLRARNEKRLMEATDMVSAMVRKYEVRD